MDRNDVIKKKFPHAFFGYDVSEVDLFLDEVIREFDRMNNKIDVLSFRLKNDYAEALTCIKMLTDQLAVNGIAPCAVISPPKDDEYMSYNKYLTDSESVQTEDDIVSDGELLSEDESETEGGEALGGSRNPLALDIPEVIEPSETQESEEASEELG